MSPIFTSLSWSAPAACSPRRLAPLFQYHLGEVAPLLLLLLYRHLRGNLLVAEDVLDALALLLHFRVLLLARALVDGEHLRRRQHLVLELKHTLTLLLVALLMLGDGKLISSRELVQTFLSSFCLLSTQGTDHVNDGPP